MAPPRPILFGEVSARLPLFDGLPEDVIKRLTVGGLGRGLLTTALRARLRRAGFVDMGMLALATPADLTSVRKVGPIRAGVIRSHVLDELARFYPDARSDHSEEATARRRMERLRAIPVERLPLDAVTIEWLGRLGRTCADLAQRPRVECEPATGILVADPDLIVVALTRLLLPDRSHTRPTAATREDDAVQEAETRRVRAEMLRERDREWDEAAPPGYARPDPRSRGRP